MLGQRRRRLDNASLIFEECNIFPGFITVNHIILDTQTPVIINTCDDEA